MMSNSVCRTRAVLIAAVVCRTNKARTRWSESTLDDRAFPSGHSACWAWQRLRRSPRRRRHRSCSASHMAWRIAAGLTGRNCRSERVRVPNDEPRNKPHSDQARRELGEIGNRLVPVEPLPASSAPWIWNVDSARSMPIVTRRDKAGPFGWWKAPTLLLVQGGGGPCHLCGCSGAATCRLRGWPNLRRC
jgi:hypothetical protein